MSCVKNNHILLGYGHQMSVTSLRKSLIVDTGEMTIYIINNSYALF